MALTIIWDGAVTTPNYNEYYCRVSERIFTKEELLGGTVVFGGETYTITGDAIVNQGGTSSEIDTGSYSIRLSNVCVMVTGVAGEYLHFGSTVPGGFTLPADGTYFARRYDTDGKYIEKLTLPNASPVLSIDYTAMVQGWIVGKRLAAMRGKK